MPKHLPNIKPKVEEEAEEEQEAETVEAKAEDVLTHFHREGMQIPTKTQEMSRVFVPAVDEPPRLVHP